MTSMTSSAFSGTNSTESTSLHIPPTTFDRFPPLHIVMRALRRKKNLQGPEAPSETTPLQKPPPRLRKGIPLLGRASPLTLSRRVGGGTSSSDSTGSVVYNLAHDNSEGKGEGNSGTVSSSNSGSSIRQAALVTPEAQRRKSGHPFSAFADHNNDVGQALEDWMTAFQNLQPHVQLLVHCSFHLALRAGGWAWHTVVMGPITLPLHVLQHILMNHQACSNPRLSTHSSNADDFSNVPYYGSDQVTIEEENDSEGHDNVLQAVVRGAWEFPGHIWGLAHAVTSHVVDVVLSPPSAVVANEDDKDFLERLRLDDFGWYEEEAFSVDKDGCHIRRDTSNFLLRVDDLGLYDIDNGDEDDNELAGDQPKERELLHYVDLAALDDPTFVLDRLVLVGVSLLANHPTVRVTPTQSPCHEIAWTPEGKTARLSRRLAPLSTLQRLEVLKGETLVWSGTFQRQEHGHSSSRFYLARGILPISPAGLLALLWDNNRTSEYNKFCLGRTTLMGDDNLELEKNDTKKDGDSAFHRTKVIQSETRVPLTSLSVKVECLMHTRAFSKTDYVIVSRSCVAGPAGSHSKALHHLRTPASEILWGLNILRAVPHRPDLVDLTSLSQVGTGGVPSFLSQRIALFGVQSFFDKVRELPSPTQLETKQEPKQSQSTHRRKSRIPVAAAVSCVLMLAASPAHAASWSFATQPSHLVSLSNGKSRATRMMPLFLMRGGAKNVTAKRRAKVKGGKEPDRSRISEALQEKDAAQAMGDAIRERAQLWRESSLLEEIDVSVASVGLAMGATNHGSPLHSDAQEASGGVDVATTSVLVHYFLKSHGGAHALQTICSLLAAVSGIGALSMSKSLSIVLLRRCMMFAMTKHLAGILAACALTAKAIPEVGFQAARHRIQDLMRDPVAQYVFYSCIVLVWLPSSLPADGQSLWWQSSVVPALLVGPILLREVVSTLYVVSDVFLLHLLSNQQSENNGQGINRIMELCGSLVNAVMSVLATAKVWRSADAIQRQVVLARVVSRASLALEVMVGLIFLVNALHDLTRFTLSNQRPSLGNVIKSEICAYLYLHFLWVRRRKIQTLATKIRGGASGLPFYVLNVMLDPMGAMGLADNGEGLPKKQHCP